MALKGNRTRILRDRIAKEAAMLIYTSQEKEYKQAKKRAAETLGFRILPSNLEIALELDRIVDEREGTKRKELIMRMRREAKEIMCNLKKFNPRLIGSVWRGTARKNSDIDIYAFSENTIKVLKELQKNNYQIVKTEWRSVTKEGRKESSFHIHIILTSSDSVEVVVRNPNCLERVERCEVFGDLKTGLNLKQLTRILEYNPLQKFVPS